MEVLLTTHPYPVLSPESGSSEVICQNPHLWFKYSRRSAGITISSIHKDMSEGQSSNYAWWIYLGHSVVKLMCQLTLLVFPYFKLLASAISYNSISQCTPCPKEKGLILWHVNIRISDAGCQCSKYSGSPIDSTLANWTCGTLAHPNLRYNKRKGWVSKPIMICLWDP